MKVAEFSSPEELRAHYATLQRKFYGPTPQSLPVSNVRLAGHGGRRAFAVPGRVYGPHKAQAIAAPGRVYGPFPLRRDFLHLADARSSERCLPSVSEIIHAVLRNFPGITVAELLGDRRGRDLTEARRAAIVAVAMSRKDMSLPQIGRAFNRDHTTVLHHLRVAGVAQSRGGA